LSLLAQHPTPPGALFSFISRRGEEGGHGRRSIRAEALSCLRHSKRDFFVYDISPAFFHMVAGHQLLATLRTPHSARYETCCMLPHKHTKTVAKNQALSQKLEAR
jgi:hypothetical protein